MNIAYALSELGKKVLLVDSDPQCNLTSYLLEASRVHKMLTPRKQKQGKLFGLPLNLSPKELGSSQN